MIWSGYPLISVLFVDNEPDILSVTKIALEQSGLFSVDTSESASAALETLKNAPYDAILSNYQMTDMDGIDFLKTLRASGNDIPFIIFTEKGREEVVIRAFENGANFYVQRGGDLAAQYAELKQKILSAVKAHRDEQELKESEARFRALLEHSLDAVFLTVPDGGILSANPSACNLLGYTEEEISRGGRDLILDRDDPNLARALAERKRSGKARGEMNMVHKDGRKIPCEITSSIFTGPNGLQMTTIIARDITGRKEAEEALRASEERYRTFVENAVEGVVVIQDGLVVYANPAALQFTSESYKEIHGKPFNLYIHPDDREMVASRYRRRIQGETLPTSYDFRLKGRGGSEIWVQLSVAVITWNGRPATLNFLSDITERKQREQILEVQHHVATLCSSAAPLSEILPECLRLILAITRMDAGGIFLVDEQGGLRLIGSVGLSAAFVEEEQYHSSDSPQTGFVTQGTPYFGPFSSLQFSNSSAKACEGIRALAVVPFKHRGRVIDCMNIASHTLETISPLTQEIIRTLAIQMGSDIARIQASEALRESEEKFRRMVETAAEGIWEMDQDFHITYTNQKMADMLGFTREEMVGKEISVYMDKNELPDSLTRMERQRQGITDHFERKFIRNDGSRLWTYASATPVFETSGTFRGSFAMYSDITSQKRTETALRESEERYRRLAENAEDLIFRYEISPTRGFSYVSPSAIKILGCTPHEHYTDPDIWLKLVYEADRHLLASLSQDSGLFQRPLVLRWKKKDGAIVWTEQVNIPVYDKDRNLVAIEGIARDITRRNAAEQELTKERQRLFDVLEALPAMVCLLTPDYQVPFANRAFRETFGEPQGRHCYEFCFGQNEPCSFCEVFTPLRTGKPHHWSYELPGGTYIDIHDFPFIDTDGSPLILEMDIDVTNQKLIEAEIRSLNRVLEQRVEERTAQLTTLLHEREVLLREVHHRVKNNLQIIISLLNLQSRYINDEKTLGAIRESQNRIKAMALVHERMYRSEEVSHIAFRDYVKFLVSHLFGFYGVASHQVTYTISMDPFPIDIDSAIPLGLIMTELISNSLKYAFPGGRKGTISLEGNVVDDHTYRFVVRDNGVGLSPEIDWKNPDTLGLRLVNSLVTQLNGTIGLDRTDGTTFTLVVHSRKGDEKGR